MVLTSRNMSTYLPLTAGFIHSKPCRMYQVNTVAHEGIITIGKNGFLLLVKCAGPTVWFTRFDCPVPPLWRTTLTAGTRRRAGSVAGSLLEKMWKPSRAAPDGETGGARTAHFFGCHLNNTISIVMLNCVYCVLFKEML